MIFLRNCGGCCVWVLWEGSVILFTKSIGLVELALIVTCWLLAELHLSCIDGTLWTGISVILVSTFINIFEESYIIVNLSRICSFLFLNFIRSNLLFPYRLSMILIFLILFSIVPSFFFSLKQSLSRLIRLLPSQDRHRNITDIVKVI